jgi:hypothetical protein
VLSGSELWLLRLMADRGLALLDADGLIVVIEEGEELRVAAASGTSSPRLRIVPSRGSALGAIYAQGQPLALERPRGDDAAWLYELGIEARSVLVEPLQLEGHGGGLVIALATERSFKKPDRDAVQAFAASVSQRLAAERSVEIERLRYGMRRESTSAHAGRGRSTTRAFRASARCACSWPTPATTKIRPPSGPPSTPPWRASGMRSTVCAT